MSKDEQITELIRTGTRLAAAIEMQAGALLELAEAIAGGEIEDTADDPPQYLDGTDY